MPSNRLFIVSYFLLLPAFSCCSLDCFVMLAIPFDTFGASSRKREVMGLYNSTPPIERFVSFVL